jgi:hypothetical protein
MGWLVEILLSLSGASSDKRPRRRRTPTRLLAGPLIEGRRSDRRNVANKLAPALSAKSPPAKSPNRRSKLSRCRQGINHFATHDS